MEHHEQPAAAESPGTAWAKHGRFGTDDPFLHEEAVRPVEALCTPLARRYGLDMAYLATPAVMLYRESIGETMRGRGSLPPGMMSFCIPVRLAAGTTFGKSPLREAGIPCSMGGTLDVVFAAGQVHFVLLIDVDRLRYTLSPESFEALERATAKLLLPASASSVQRLVAWLGRVLQEVPAQPRLLHCPEPIRTLEEDLIRQLVAAVDCRPTKPLVERPYSRARGLDRALDYLYTRELSGIDLSALCQAAAVSQRTLERAFRDNFDMSAREYLKRRRLHTVRRRLMASRKGEATVTDIAYAHGFYELGRFAVAYRRLFGERPSETLDRDGPEPRAVLIGVRAARRLI